MGISTIILRVQRAGRREWVNEGIAGREVVPFRCEECGGEFAETQAFLNRTTSDLVDSLLHWVRI
jgi:hypothetical protein